MQNTKPTLLALIFVLSGSGGCTAITTNVDRAAENESFHLKSSTFVLKVDNGSEGKPNNWDGNLNLLWTNDAKRAEVVSEQIDLRVESLEEAGFRFDEEQPQPIVDAILTIYSVRFDPLAGWTTDGAKIDYVEAESGKSIGTVDVVEVWVTPPIKKVFRALVQGSIELWSTDIEE